jgi:hypothetical protein
MYATLRRYEGIDTARSGEVTRKVAESLAPSLGKLPGFAGYYLIDAGDGVFTSISLFESSNEAAESTRISEGWVREQKLESALPNAPKITMGQVTVHESQAAAVTNGAPALA